MEQQKCTEKEIKDKKVSRRDFMKVAGVAAVGVGMGGCASGPGKTSKKMDLYTPVSTTGKRKHDARDEYDVVVIGTGMGGSAAGAISALHGLKTLILEKNPRPGGSCSYYEKQGFRIDTGAHMFIRGNKGPFGELTKRMGMGTPIDFVRAKNTLAVRGMNINVTLPKSLFGRALAVPSMGLQSRINLLQVPSIMNLFRKIVLMPEKDAERLDNVTIDEFMVRYTKNPEVRSMIAGLLGLMVIVPPWDASAGESIWNLQKFIRGMSVSYPRGGCNTIPRTFLKGAENHGAEIYMSAGVKNIEVKDGKVVCVILDNGEKIKTRAVISTSSVKDTILRMVGEAYFSPDYVEKVKTIYPSFTAVQAKLALKKELVPAGCLLGGLPLRSSRNIIPEYVQVAFTNSADGKQGDYIPIYAPIPTSFDPTLAPPGCQLITAVALAPTLEVELEDTEQSWIDGMMRALTQMIPKLEENIIFCDTWSVTALAQWIGKSSGSAISTGQVVGQVGKYRHPHETPIEGLYLAGDCAGPARGVGTELACQSGMDCGDLVARNLKA